MTEQDKVLEENIDIERKNAMMYNRTDFAKLVINDLSSTQNGRGFLKKYKQSEVREIIENFTVERNQVKLREISKLLWAKSPQYQRLIKYFAGMATFAHIIAPVKDLRKANRNKVSKQYVEIGELLKLMNLRHEMTKVLNVAFREDIFYGYIHRDKKSFYIQQMPSDICKAFYVEDGILNYSVDMNYFEKNEKTINRWALEIQMKYREWKAKKDRDGRAYNWVELESKNTICIKVNEDILEIFPPFAGSFDSIFDIDAFKQLRKDKEELGNYMLITQRLPMRDNSDTNNDFLIDKEFMMFFHNQASDIVPENVGVITSPMEIEPIRFDQDRADQDGVGKATRDFWEGNGASQLLFSSNNTSSSGLTMSIKTDEEIVFAVLTQIQRWLNRYLKEEFSELLFHVNILHVTIFNQQEMYKMFLESAQFGAPVKSHLVATIGLDPIEVMNMSFLENDILKMHEEWIPLQSAHTMGDDDAVAQQKGKEGTPKKSAEAISDEGARSRDKK